MLEKRRWRAIAETQTGRPHPDGVARPNLHVVAFRTMAMRWSNGPLELVDEIRGSPGATGNVVTHVQHSRRTRRGRQQRVERRDAPRFGRRQVEPCADVLEPRLADPPDARLQCFQGRQQEMPALASFTSAMCNVRVVEAPTFSTIPCGRRRAEQ